MILISLCYLLSIKRSYDPIQFQATLVLFTILPSIPYLVGLHFNQRQTKNMQQHEKISDYLEEWLWINWQFQLVSIKSKNTYCNTHHNLVCSAVLSWLEQHQLDRHKRHLPYYFYCSFQFEYFVYFN